MNMARLMAIGMILCGAGVAWYVLGSALEDRSASAGARLGSTVVGNLGSAMVQEHPEIYYLSSTSAHTKRFIQPEKTHVRVVLDYEPRRKGLLWYRAYGAEFEGEYVVRNPTPITQTVYMRFSFPAEGARYDRFSLAIGEKNTEKMPVRGEIIESVILGPGAETPLRVSYHSTGLDDWVYSFGKSPRVRNFALQMQTNFAEINMPAGTESPTAREVRGDGWDLAWEYSDVIGARSIGMDMPAVVNPGPVAARMTYFAPLSLLFFFAVLVIMGMVRGVNLHPINYFFLAAGCFAFQLLFAYLVDLIPVLVAFALSAVVSIILVSGYLWRAVGVGFARLAAVAQFAYMILFSYSFFFPGLTGITITVGAILTLGILMGFTAKLDWGTILVRKRRQVSPAVPGAVPASGPPPIK